MISPRRKFSRFLIKAMDDWERLHDRRLTVTEWGREIGIEKDRVTTWRNGDGLPSAESLVQLVDFFGWDGNDVMRALGTRRPQVDGENVSAVSARPKLNQLVGRAKGLPNARLDDLIRIADALAEREAV